MAKSCFCGSPLCPICKGHRPSGIDELNLLAKGQLPRGGIRRKAEYKFGARETRSVRSETPNVLRNEPETEVVRPVYQFAERKDDVLKQVGACPSCGRPYCPECGDPIPVRGNYCKPACRSRAWRKKKAE